MMAGGTDRRGDWVPGRTEPWWMTGARWARRSPRGSSSDGRGAVSDGSSTSPPDVLGVRVVGRGFEGGVTRPPRRGFLLLIVIQSAGWTAGWGTRSPVTAGGPQPRHPLLDRRMGREQVGELHLPAAERVDDVLLGLGGSDVHGDGLGGVVELDQ